MGRKIRHLLEADGLVEITGRCIQRRFLLRPSAKLNAIIRGVLARAQKRHGMRVCGFVYLSNHYHLLIRPASVRQMAAFMRDVNYKISKEVGYLHEWEGTVWPRPYGDVQVSDEAEAQVLSLRYLLEQGCKEGLVASPKHWPGASSTKALLSGERVEGIWIDRTAQYRAWERGEPNPDARFTSVHRLELSPIPCWAHLRPHQYQAGCEAWCARSSGAWKACRSWARGQSARSILTTPRSRGPAGRRRRASARSNRRCGGLWSGPIGSS